MRHWLLDPSLSFYASTLPRPPFPCFFLFLSVPLRLAFTPPPLPLFRLILILFLSYVFF